MITNFKQFNENLLVPRNLEGRKDKLKQLNIKMLSQEVIDGDIQFDNSFMDIDPKFVKVKKVIGFVCLDGGKWTEIPEWLKNVEISESFDCSGNELTSLKNCPQNIGGSFYCLDNKLISLEGCLKFVGLNFYCSRNQLTSLEGCPEIIEGDLICVNNKIKLELPENVKLKGKFYN